MAPRAQPIHLAIGHVRNPGQRVPVAGVPGDKRPAYAVRRQSPLYVRIVGDVVRIIVADEIAPE